LKVRSEVEIILGCDGRIIATDCSANGYLTATLTRFSRGAGSGGDFGRIPAIQKVKTFIEVALQSNRRDERNESDPFRAVIPCDKHSVVPMVTQKPGALLSVARMPEL
jgi:hypothetical protein